MLPLTQKHIPKLTDVLLNYSFRYESDNNRRRRLRLHLGEFDATGDVSVHHVRVLQRSLGRPKQYVIEGATQHSFIWTTFCDANSDKDNCQSLVGSAPTPASRVDAAWADWNGKKSHFAFTGRVNVHSRVGLALHQLLLVDASLQRDEQGTRVWDDVATRD